MSCNVNQLLSISSTGLLNKHLKIFLNLFDKRLCGVTIPVRSYIYIQAFVIIPQVQPFIFVHKSNDVTYVMVIWEHFLFVDKSLNLLVHLWIPGP